MTSKRYISTALFTLCWLIAVLPVAAQRELGLAAMPQVLQAQETNPALMNDAKFTLALPSAYVHFANTGFTMRDALLDSTDGKTYFAINRVVSGLQNNDYMQIYGDVDAFRLSLRPTKRYQATLSAKMCNHLHIFYPAEAMKFAILGNADRLNESVNIAPRFETSTYFQAALTQAFSNEEGNITYGFTVKYLNGLVNAGTDDAHSKATIYTQDDSLSTYQTLISADYVVHTSGLVINKEQDYYRNLLNQVRRVPSAALTGNHGAAIDFGLQAKLTEKLTFGLSLIDIGAIRWKDNVASYSSNGYLLAEGININNILFSQGGGVTRDSVNMKAILDTLQRVFKFTKSNDAYNTWLPTRGYMTLQWQAAKVIRVGGIVGAEYYKRSMMPFYGINANLDLGKGFTLGAMYNYRDRQNVNLGANASLKVGPLQFFIYTDNVLTVFRPFDNKIANVRLGLNFRFGSYKNKEED